MMRMKGEWGQLGQSGTDSSGVQGGRGVGNVLIIVIVILILRSNWIDPCTVCPLQPAQESIQVGILAPQYF